MNGLLKIRTCRFNWKGTDERGTNEYNLALGERRAKAVFDYLINLGASPSQFSLVSFGEERPADRGSNEVAWRKNRRVEFTRL